MTPLHQIVAMLEAGPTPTPTPSCPNAPEICQLIYKQTGQVWVAEGSYLFLVKPLQILLIVALAALARFLINRTIDRLVRATTNDSSPALLRPLRQRMPNALRNASVMPERRRQRAEALGSVLRSITSAVVFAVAVMMVLGQLGIQLAPLLASAGIAGLAIGFGAQNLVKDFIAGLFMLLEDQYGVGDVVDLGAASGTVEAVGLRITTIRDARGVVWYIRNGEIARVGNKSQGWAMVIVDVPVGFAGVEEATEILRRAAASLADDPEWAESLIEAPEVLGVEQISADGAVLRTTVKTTQEAQAALGRELRWRLNEALESAGVTAKSGGQLYLPPVGAEDVDAPGDGTAPGAGTAPGDGTAPGASTAPGGERQGPERPDVERARRRPAPERPADTAVTSAASSPEVAEGLTERGTGTNGR